MRGRRETRRPDEVRESFERVIMEAPNTFRFVGDGNGSLATCVLCRNTRRATICVARLRLDAAEGKHEATTGVAPVRTQREGSRNVERSDDSSSRTNFDTITHADTVAVFVVSCPSRTPRQVMPVVLVQLLV